MATVLLRDGPQHPHSKMWPITNTTNNQDSSDSSDEDVLQAVLEFVESFDGVASAASSHKPTSTRSSRSRKQHSSERIRTEIQALKDLAVQLEDRVAHLQYERTHQQMQTRRASVPGGWELEAMRQEEQRLEAEMQNLELKQLVEAQTRVANRLELLFARNVQRGDASEPSFSAVVGHQNAFTSMAESLPLDQREHETSRHPSNNNNNTP